MRDLAVNQSQCPTRPDSMSTYRAHQALPQFPSSAMLFEDFRKNAQAVQPGTHLILHKAEPSDTSQTRSRKVSSSAFLAPSSGIPLHPLHDNVPQGGSGNLSHDHTHGIRAGWRTVHCCEEGEGSGIG